MPKRIETSCWHPTEYTSTSLIHFAVRQYNIAQMHSLGCQQHVSILFDIPNFLMKTVEEDTENYSFNYISSHYFFHCFCWNPPMHLQNRRNKVPPLQKICWEIGLHGTIPPTASSPTTWQSTSGVQRLPVTFYTTCLPWQLWVTVC